MTQWNRSEIETKIKSLRENLNIEIKEPGGDHDITGFVIYLSGKKDDPILLAPYQDPSSEINGLLDNCDIYAVELRTAHGDAGGGCQSDDKEVNYLYVDIKLELEKMGFYIIRHYDEIF